MITTRPHGRPNGALLARIQRRLTPRWQTVAQIAGHDMVGDVSRALSTLERDGLAEREGQRWRRAGAPATTETEPEAAPTSPAEPTPAVLTAEVPTEPTVTERGQAARSAIGATTRARVLAALTEHHGLTARELGAAVGVTPSRADQLVRELGCVSVAEAPGRTARRRWYPPGWSQPKSSTPPSPEPGSQTPEHQAPGSGSVQADEPSAAPPAAEPLAGVERPLGDTCSPPPEASGGSSPEAGEPPPLCRECGEELWSTADAPPICMDCAADGPDRSAPTWPELLERVRRDGSSGLVDVTWGADSLAELLASAVQALIEEEETTQQLEAELRVVGAQRAAVDDGPRQELAQIRALVGADHPLPIAVALVVGAAQALRARP